MSGGYRKTRLVARPSPTRPAGRRKERGEDEEEEKNNTENKRVRKFRRHRRRHAARRQFRNRRRLIRPEFSAAFSVPAPPFSRSPRRVERQGETLRRAAAPTFVVPGATGAGARAPYGTG